jgi:hypothetical protein
LRSLGIAGLLMIASEAFSFTSCRRLSSIVLNFAEGIHFW